VIGDFVEAEVDLDDAPPIDSSSASVRPDLIRETHTAEMYLRQMVPHRRRPSDQRVVETIGAE
jgi:hypothetical protein